MRNEFARSAWRALELANMRPVSPSEVFSLSLDQAFERIAPYFADLPLLANGERSSRWDTTRGAILGILGSNYKLDKDDLPDWIGFGVHVLGLSLVPSTMAEIANLCAFASKECAISCLRFAGRNAMEYPQKLGLGKARAVIRETAAFLRILIAAISRESVNAYHRGELLAVRLNVLADIPWEIVAPWLFSYFAGWNVVFYDYTKVPGREAPRNYDLTFSYTGRNDRHVAHELARGQRIAVVGPEDAPIPAQWRGLDVINGDRHDLRIADPARCVVWLSYKPPNDGRASEIDPGVFIVDPLDSRPFETRRSLPIAA